MAGLTDVIESDLIPIVIKSAPVLGGILGGPFASVGLALIGSLFHIDSKKIEDFKSVLQSDPDAAIKLKTIEDEHAEALQQIAAINYQTEVNDRESARQYGYQYKDFLLHMAFVVTGGFFLALFAMFMPLNLSEQEKQLLSMLLGMLASKWQTIIDFFYGSSRQHITQGAQK